MASILILGVCFLSLVHRPTGPIAQAAIFSPDCTLPPVNTTFVASPNTRGTLSILWSCLSVIILCTWNIQHLNIPSTHPYFDNSGRRIKCWKRAWWAMKDLWTSLKWMLLTVLIPEYIMGKALSERLAATSSLGTLRSRFGDEMELIHAYIMNMGGYFLDFSEVGFSGVDVTTVKSTDSSGLGSTAVDYSGVHFSGSHVNNLSSSLTKTKSLSVSGNHIPLHLHAGKPPMAATNHERSNFSCPADHEEIVNINESHSRELVIAESLNTSNQLQSLERSRFDASTDSGNVASQASAKRISTANMSSFQALNLSRFKLERWALTALQLINAKGFKLYEHLPPISAQELESLSNSDSLVKLLAVIQIAWLMIKLLVRYKTNIISSQLEVATLAFSVCSLLTYSILWNRPRGVTRRYRVKATRIPKLDEITSLAIFGPGYLWTWSRSHENIDEDLCVVPIPNDASHAVDVRSVLGEFGNTVAGRTLLGWLRYNHPAIVSVIAGSALGGTLFGALHCLAWNFVFPTRTELVIWRVCSILTTVLPVLSIYFNLQWSYYNGWVDYLEGETVSRFHGPVLLIFFLVPYVLARLFLLVETFRSLFFLPSEAFIDTWPGVFLLWG